MFATARKYNAYIAMVAGLMVLAAAPAWANKMSQPLKNCGEASWYGQNCVTINFQSSVDQLSAVQAAVDKQLAVFDQLLAEKKINVFLLQSKGYGLNSPQGNESQWQLFGWAQYALPSPEDAIVLIEFLQSRNYQASQGSGEVICSH